ncbi:MAG: dihydroorotate dehydrogenase electron transfer subunit [Candidatus Cloacimonetes bacterium]|nr:dihydroorotate dehydrogenase electron transfer subunit [Candidatus Cloacimonadota bacterium]MDD4687520.1 dihydroorotate dehydrogenase electron transfer subunit [Candidatus Cloacimonadota bacterium]
MIKPQYHQRAIQLREELSDNYFILWIWDETLGAAGKPGQFYEIRAVSAPITTSFAEQTIPKLYKPVSIYDNQGGRIGFMIKKVGPGTVALSRLHAGDTLEIIGPCGNGFPIVIGRRVLLISGGIGYPPLWYLQKEIINHNQIYWMHGGASQGDVFPCDEIWTEDGSIGRKGKVCDGLQAVIDKYKIDTMYSCGPQGLLKAAAEMSIRNNIEHYCSLESYMACGIGVCYGCAVPIGTPENWTYRRVCKDGPVFNAREVRWELL